MALTTKCVRKEIARFVDTCTNRLCRVISPEVVTYDDDELHVYQFVVERQDGTDGLGGVVWARVSDTIPDYNRLVSTALWLASQPAVDEAPDSEVSCA